MAGPRRVHTMEELAKASGISRPTLSKYFNNAESVRPSTRKRIEEALRVYDYTPNIYAVNQNRRMTRNIGIVVPNLADPFFTEMGREAELACIDAGYSPIMLSSHGDPEQEVANLESLLALKPAGVLLSPFGRVSQQDKVLRLSERMPIVLFDANIEGSALPFFGTDNDQSVALMVDYLCRSGSPPCFFEIKNPLNPNARKRHAAYQESMMRHGHTPHIYQVEGDGWAFEDIGYREGGRLLREDAFATNTVLCSNDRLAIGMLAAAYGQNIKVGITDDSVMRIAGHDDHPFARFTGPRLTTIAQEYKTIALSAASLLVDMIEGEPPGRDPVRVENPGRLVMRESA